MYNIIVPFKCTIYHVIVSSATGYRFKHVHLNNNQARELSEFLGGLRDSDVQDDTEWRPSSSVTIYNEQNPNGKEVRNPGMRIRYVLDVVRVEIGNEPWKSVKSWRQRFLVGVMGQIWWAHYTKSMDDLKKLIESVSDTFNHDIDVR